MESTGRPDGFLDLTGAEYAAPYLRALDDDLAPAPDGRIGPWRIVGEAGRGGMGTVYLAERADGQFPQRVALKVVRGILTLDDHHLRRFREERRMLAALEHPNIARLIDGGVTDDGVPWFAMEFIAGLPIDRHVRSRALAIEARLRLFLEACDAVQHAHQHLIVHRDLKPSNLLVDADGRVKLLDFGVARLLDTETETETRTDHATLPATARLMTPAYASPEQLRGEPIAVASDVYSLGVILYELLAGQPPHRDDPRQPHLLTRAILEIEPPPPSTVAPAEIRRRLGGDLDTIVAMALRKDPGHRYRSVEALADDLRRHLTARPIAARGHAAGYRLRRYLRRYRLQVTAAALVITTLLAGVSVSVTQARHADRQRDLARLETARAEAVARFLINVFHLANPNVALGETINVAAALDSAAVWLDRDPGAHPEARAEIALALGGIFGAMGRADDHRRLADSALAIQERQFGSDDPRLAWTLTTLAEAMRGQGRLASAEPLLRRARALQHPGDAIPAREIDHTLNMLALSLRDQGRLTEAESLLREALVISRRDATTHPIGLHRTLTNLAHVLLAEGNPAEAEALHHEVLALRRLHWGQEHPEIANTLINLANAVGRQARYGEAEALFEEGLAMRRRLQGERHSEVGGDLAGLAALYRRAGDLARAETTYREAVAHQRGALGVDHPVARATAESLDVVRRARRPGGQAARRP